MKVLLHIIVFISIATHLYSFNESALNPISQFCSSANDSLEIDIQDIRSQLFISSNTMGKFGLLNFDYDDNENYCEFPSSDLDADGIYYDKFQDQLFQLNRTANVIDRYDNVMSKIAVGETPEVSMSSSSDFINGREIAVIGDRLIVAQDANDANGQQNKFIVYQITADTIMLEKSIDTEINLWGIQFINGDLWAVEDNSDRLVWYSDFLNINDDIVSPDGSVVIENMIRTHGLTYYAEDDLMLLTDVGAASSPDDGAFLVVADFSSTITDGMISEDEQLRVEGINSNLGNPVDIAFDFNTEIIYVAERANEGGKILSFDIPVSSQDLVPENSWAFAGASAVYLNSNRVKDQYIPFNPEYDGRLLFTGRLSGNNQVPTVSTSATGVMGILLNTEMNSATFNLSISGLSGNITGVHLHESPSGQNGDVVLNLTDQFLNNRISTELPVDKDLLNKLMHGNIYVNVHSEVFPDGELRAQLLLEKDLSFVNWISGEQEVPAVETEGIGLISANLTQVMNQLEINALFKNLSSPIIGAHLHNAAESANGDVVADLSTMVFQNTIIGTVSAADFVGELKAGNIYLNIHTEENPGGEIRAQLNQWTGINTDGWISGDQSVPQVSTGALGFVATNVDPEMESITIWALTLNLDNGIAASHLHLGAQGQNGDVLLSLDEGINGEMINLNTSNFDDSIITELVGGNVYLNIHTASNPDGEIRAQLYPLTRDSYNFDICTSQENSEVINADSANGGAILSLDRKRSNMHLMAVVSNTSGDISGVHLHQAPMNEDGDVILDLSSNLSDNGVFLYYGITDFRDIIGAPIKEERVYINFHTEDNPGGELRGQVIKELLCEIATSSINNVIGKQEIVLYPNPAKTHINLKYPSAENFSYFDIFNSAGMLVKTGKLSEEQTTLLISDLHSGNYYIRIQSLNDIQVIKFSRL